MERSASHTDPPIWRERALLFQTWDRGEAWIVSQLMSSYGISTQVVAGISPLLFPLPLSQGFQVMVACDRLREAERLLADHLRQGLRVLPGGRRERRRTRK